MAITTANMGLTAWTSGTDPYSNTQLSGNFETIDAHNHGGAGLGAPLVAASLGTGIVQWAAIQANAVQGSAGANGTNIYPGSITATELAAGSVTSTQLTAGAISSAIPIGTVTAWFRPNTGISIPTNWHVCDGSTLASNQHNFPGGGSVTLPNLLNNFILGCQPGGTGNAGPTVPPGELVTGGSNQQSISHTHTIPTHNHDLSNHTHTIGSHVHSISSDGSHSHTFNGGFDLHSRPNAAQVTFLSFYDSGQVLRIFSADSAYVGSYAGTDTDEPMDNAGAHSHTGSTGGSGVLSSGGPSANATSSVSLDSLGPDTSLPSDFRPNFIGLIYIVKVQ